MEKKMEHEMETGIDSETPSSPLSNSYNAALCNPPYKPPLRSFYTIAHIEL